jgi:hypothetical protein
MLNPSFSIDVRRHRPIRSIELSEVGVFVLDHLLHLRPSRFERSSRSSTVVAPRIKQREE